MAGITTIDTILTRIQRLIRYQVNTETALIDTRNNAVATTDSDTANNFTTPTIASAAVQLHADQAPAQEVRIIIGDSGSVTNAEFQDRGYVMGTTEPDSTLPRLDRRFKVLIGVRVGSGSGTIWRAHLICNRVAEAVGVVMDRYTNLAIPGASVAELGNCYWTRTDDGRSRDSNEDEWQFAERIIKGDVRTIESRA